MCVSCQLIEYTFDLMERQPLDFRGYRFTMKYPTIPSAIVLRLKKPNKVPMKQLRITETQIIAIQQEVGTGMKVRELCRKHGISPARTTTGSRSSAE